MCSDHILLSRVFLLRLYFYNLKDQYQFREHFFHEVWNEKHFPDIKKPLKPPLTSFIIAVSLLSPFKVVQNVNSQCYQKYPGTLGEIGCCRDDIFL